MKNLIVLIVCLMGIAFYAYKHIDWNPPKKQTITSVQVNGKTIPVSKVRIEQIPQAVYESGGIPNWNEHLLGNKKRALFIVWDRPPYEKTFRTELNKAFGKKGALRKYYINDIIAYNGEGARCKDEYCAIAYLLNLCVDGFCIINPKTKEAIVDDSQNAKQILPLLMAYATWDTEPLLGKNK